MFSLFKNINKGLEEYRSTSGAILLDVREVDEYRSNSTITNKSLWEEKYSSVLNEYRNALGGQSGAGQLPDDVSYS